MSTMLQSDQILSTQEAAVFLGLTDGRVRQMILAGEVAAQRHGKHAWAIARAELERLKKSRQPQPPATTSDSG
jgi:excisionase family DNA binding protein